MIPQTQARGASEILLITRIRTLNKGNQALSAAWLAMVKHTFPQGGIRLLERRPRHLLQHRLADIAAARDPYAAFDALTDALARLAPGPSYTAPVFTRDARILLDETISPPRRFVGLRERLNLRGLLARTGYYADEYRHRLSACQRAQLVIVNPAGEFFPRGPQAAFYHLLDADVARKLGVSTAIVNHTMDISDPTLRAIIPRMYRSLAMVGFRDQTSVVAFEAMGGDTRNVVVTPDLALTIELTNARPRRPGAVAVAINVPEAAAHGYLERWVDVIAKLRAQETEVVLVSNEVPADLEFYERLMARFPGLQLEGAGLDHDAYGELLGSFDSVVSSRMHTCILAMVAGAPVVAVEGASFKITGLFKELGFTDGVLDPTSPDLPRLVGERVAQRRAARDAASQETRERIAQVRDRITGELVTRLRAAT